MQRVRDLHTRARTTPLKPLPISLEPGATAAPLPHPALSPTPPTALCYPAVSPAQRELSAATHAQGVASQNLYDTPANPQHTHVHEPGQAPHAWRDNRVLSLRRPPLT